MVKKLISKEKALDRLQGLCSRSEQCEFDLTLKLINWGISSSDRKEIIEKLREERYIDNSRFAVSYARDKARFSAWGPAKIRGELIKRRLPSAVISAALKSVEPEVWKNALLKSAQSKGRTLDFTDPNVRESKQKLYRYLIGRGFPSAAVAKTVAQMSKLSEE